MLQPSVTILFPCFHVFSPKLGRLLSPSNDIISAKNKVHATVPEDDNRRQLLALFIINAVPLFVGTEVARSEEDEFEEFGKSLSKATSGYPYTHSPLPSKFSSALDLSSSSSKDREQEESIEIGKEKEKYDGLQSKTLDEVLNDAKKSKKSQIGPLSHGY
jgi:hypothetical protein